MKIEDAIRQAKKAFHHKDAYIESIECGDIKINKLLLNSSEWTVCIRLSADNELAKAALALTGKRLKK